MRTDVGLGNSAVILPTRTKLLGVFLFENYIQVFDPVGSDGLILGVADLM
jgi:hypothetical protein